jgi:hypothetical protein
MSNFGEYTPWDDNLMAEEDAQLAKSRKNNYLKPKDGNNTLRILPGVNGHGPFTVVWTHEIPTADRPYGKRFTCPNKHGGAYCDACAKSSLLRATKNEEDDAQAQKIGAKRKVYCVVIDRNDEAAGPMICDKIGFKKYDEFFRPLAKDKVNGGDFTHPKTGFDIIMRKSGAKLETRYEYLPARNSTPLGNDEWLTKIPDLSSYATPSNPEEIRAALQHFLGDIGPEPEKLTKVASRTAVDDISV